MLLCPKLLIYACFVHVSATPSLTQRLYVLLFNPISLKNSFLVFSLFSMQPKTQLVTVVAVVFSTPLMTIPVGQLVGVFPGKEIGVPTKMGRFDHDANTLRFQDLHNRIGHVLGQPFLNL